jgi:hypothetical protein
MVNTLFAGKVIFVNQAIIMFYVCCRRLAEGGVEWLWSGLLNKINIEDPLYYLNLFLYVTEAAISISDIRA